MAANADLLSKLRVAEEREDILVKWVVQERRFRENAETVRKTMDAAVSAESRA